VCPPRTTRPVILMLHVKTTVSVGKWGLDVLNLQNQSYDFDNSDCIGQSKRPLGAEKDHFIVWLAKEGKQ
jgi:hypothetical protein